MTVSERVRARLAELLKRRGSSAALIYGLHRSSVSQTKLTPSQISEFLKGKPGRGFQLDWLDDVARELGITVSDLLGLNESNDLNAAEERLLLAFQPLPRETQAAVLHLVEELATLAVPSDTQSRRGLSDQGRSRRIESPKPSSDAPAEVSPAVAEAITLGLDTLDTAVRSRLESDRQQAPDPHADETRRRAHPPRRARTAR